MKKNEKKEESKKAYVEPVIEKHKAVSLISGSGSSCNLYSSSSTSNISGTTYYH